MPTDASKPAAKSSFFFGKVFFEAETALYLALSLADLLMTNYLLQQNIENLQFVESNPIARWVINHWGIRGMIYFKFAMVAFVIVVTQVIARRRPLTARLVLFFAIVIMIYVVVYSVRLYHSHATGAVASLGWLDLVN